MRIVTIGSVLCASVLVMNADTAGQKKRFAQELRHVPVPELPLRAAELVRQTPAAERSQAAIIAVETIVEKHPTAAVGVVSAISKVAPEASAAAAGAATRLAPAEAANIDAAARNGSRQASEGSARALHHREDHSQGDGNANGGVGVGPGPNKPGNPVVHDRPINTVLPNGKPRHFPPDPPRRPVTPPRPHKYNKPKPH